MTNKDIILNIVKNEQEPNPDFCPNIILYWGGSNKKGVWTKYYYPSNGRVFTNDYPDKDAELNVWNQESPTKEVLNKIYYWKVPFQYIRYFPNEGCCEFASVYIECSRPDKTKIMDKRNWEWVPWMQRMFLFENDTVPYDVNGDPLWPDDQGKFYNKKFASRFTDINKFPTCGFSCEEFRKFTKFDSSKEDYKPYYNTSMETYWGRKEWYINLMPRPVSKAKEAFKNDVLSLKLDTLEDIGKKYPAVAAAGNYGNPRGSMSNWIYEKISDTACVFRYISWGSETWDKLRYLVAQNPNEVSELYETPEYEGERLYIINGKACAAFKNYKTKEYEKSAVRVNNYSNYSTIVNLQDVMNDPQISKYASLLTEYVSQSCTHGVKDDSKFPKFIAMRAFVNTITRPILQTIYADDSLKELFKTLVNREDLYNRIKLDYDSNFKPKETEFEKCFNMTPEQWVELYKITTHYNAPKILITAFGCLKDIPIDEFKGYVRSVAYMITTINYWYAGPLCSFVPITQDQWKKAWSWESVEAMPEQITYLQNIIKWTVNDIKYAKHNAKIIDKIADFRKGSANTIELINGYVAQCLAATTPEEFLKLPV